LPSFRRKPDSISLFFEFCREAGTDKVVDVFVVARFIGRCCYVVVAPESFRRTPESRIFSYIKTIPISFLLVQKRNRGKKKRRPNRHSLRVFYLVAELIPPFRRDSNIGDKGILK